jgi:hypothetical protein
MEANTESKTEAETFAATFCPAAYASLFSQGLNWVLEANKAFLKLAVQQKAELLGSCKEAMKALSMPDLFLFDLAEQASVHSVTLQKSLMDLAVEQSTAETEASHEYVQHPRTAKAGMGKLIEQSVDRTVTAPSSALSFVATQTKSVSGTVKKQPKVAGTTQKELLNNTAKASKPTVAKA